MGINEHEAKRVFSVCYRMCPKAIEAVKDILEHYEAQVEDEEIDPDWFSSSKLNHKLFLAAPDDIQVHRLKSNCLFDSVTQFV